MAFATSNRAALNFIEEVTFGTTPPNPALQALRFKGESLNYNLSNISSEEIRSDRNTTDLIQVSADASGDIDFELSYNTFDLFIEGVMASDWSTPLNITAATDIAFVQGTPDTLTSSTTNFVTAGIVVGQWIKITGCSVANNNGFFKVGAVATNLLTIHSSMTTITADPAGDPITITGSVIRNGTTLKSYTIQKILQDVSSYFNFVGCRVGSMSMDFKTGQILTGKFGIMGMNSVADTGQISGATIVPAPTNTPMNAVSNVASIYEDYSTMTAKFNSLTVDINANLRPQKAIGTLGNIGIALGKFEVSGSIELYFENNTMYTKYINGTEFSFSFRLQGAQGHSYIVTIPRAKYESGSVVAGGLDQDVMLSASWRGIYDSISSCAIQIDKFN